jgi:predicted nucleotidyltransferase component of viral defense system
VPPDAIARGLAWKPLERADLARIARELGVPEDVVAKDYLQGYVLAGIAATPRLAGLRFKGGTALKKMYFGDYRFSEDLDFSAVDAPRGDGMTGAVGDAVAAAERLLAEEGRFRLEFDRPPERGPHPGGQDAFRLRVAFPWQSAPQVRVKLEITHDEPLLLPAARLPIIHGYEALGHTLPPGELATYPLEEIVAEKLRALRQTQQRLEQRGWNKPRARDFYDLWFLLRQDERPVDRAAVAGILDAKMAARGVAFRDADDFFAPQLVAEARRTWRANLGTFVRSLPDLDTVLDELRPLVAAIVAARP